MYLADALGLGSRELVSFVGAGGKKTAMRRLVAEGGDRGLAVGYTTTTHVPPPELPLVVADPERVGAALDDRDPPLAFASGSVSDPERAPEKLRGFEPVVVDGVFENGRFDWLLVKADGARQREFKAPGPDEPVLPTTTTHAVVVASVAAVGEPLADDRVHRVDRVAAVTGTAPGDELDAAAVGTVLASPEGGCKGVPPGATVTFLVNKADTPSSRTTARDVLERAFARTDRRARGVVTSFRTGVYEVVEPAGGP